MNNLLPLAEKAAALLKARGETIAVAESSSGGLVSAALLAVPGASAYYLGGAVVYTYKARGALLDIPDAALAGMRPATEPYALLLARTARARLSAHWASPRAAPRDRAATATAMPPGTRASPSRARSSRRRRSNWQGRSARQYARLRGGGARASDAKPRALIRLPSRLMDCFAAPAASFRNRLPFWRRPCRASTSCPRPI